ncbi:YfhD family protein [Mesobacillus thioparans]
MKKDDKKPIAVDNTQNMDNPEQYETRKKSLHDQFESELTVDPIPMEDLNQEKQEEKDGHHSKDSSSSEKKYNVDTDNDL